MAYASLGVRFGSLEINDPKGPYFDPFAGPTLWVTDGARSPLQQIGFHIYAEFDRPVTSISFDAFGGAGFSIEAHARDELGNEIGFVASPATLLLLVFAGCSAYRRRAQRPGPPDNSLGG